MCCLMHAAAAVACGGTVGGPIVSHGSLPGQRWAQRACSDGPRLLDVETDLPQVGYDDGGGMQVPFPLSAHVLYIDVPYEKYGTGREDGVTGVTALDVRRLKFDFRRGPSSNVYPHLAPAAERARHPYLRQLRFFATWYAGGRGIPTRICEVATHGRLLGCRRFSRRDGWH